MASNSELLNRIAKARREALLAEVDQAYGTPPGTPAPEPTPAPKPTPSPKPRTKPSE
jgi:hypothetical protein